MAKLCRAACKEWIQTASCQICAGMEACEVRGTWTRKSSDDEQTLMFSFRRAPAKRMFAFNKAKPERGPTRINERDALRLIGLTVSTVRWLWPVHC